MQFTYITFYNCIITAFLERKGNTWVLKVGRSGYRVAVDVIEAENKVKILYIQLIFASFFLKSSFGYNKFRRDYLISQYSLHPCSIRQCRV